MGLREYDFGEGGNAPPRQDRGIPLQQGEREFVTGGLSGAARFRLIVSGPIGSKEIGRLLRKLEMEKEIVEEAEAAEAAQAARDGDGQG